MDGGGDGKGEQMGLLINEQIQGTGGTERTRIMQMEKLQERGEEKGKCWTTGRGLVRGVRAAIQTSTTAETATFKTKYYLPADGLNIGECVYC